MNKKEDKSNKIMMEMVSLMKKHKLSLFDGLELFFSMIGVLAKMELDAGTDFTMIERELQAGYRQILEFLRNQKLKTPSRK